MLEEKQYHNWPGLVEYTKEFKEWIWKLFRKFNTRISHVELELAKVRDASKYNYQLEISSITADKIVYTLYEKVSGVMHGSIEISPEGSIAAVQWYDDTLGDRPPLTKVYRWSGPENEWISKIISGAWDDCLVFGHVYENGLNVNKIYIGKRVGSWEFKSAVVVTSADQAERLASDEFNIGLIINVVNNNNPSENGTYVVSGEHVLEPLREVWKDEINTDEIPQNALNLL